MRHLSIKILSNLINIIPDYVGPTDGFWRHNKLGKTVIIDGEEQYGNIDACIKNLLTDNDRKEMEVVPSNRTIGKIIIETDEENYGQVFFVEVKNAMTPVHVKAVQALASCIRQLIPRMYESRAIYKAKKEEEPVIGGNNPTHLAPLLQIFLPEVKDDMIRTMQLAYNTAGWYESLTIPDKTNFSRTGESRALIHPEPKDLGFRSSEHLTYDGFPLLDPHLDGYDTAYTFNYFFSHPKDYEGGELYFTDNAGIKTSLKPQKYSASIFLGGTYRHGVAEINGGKRELFANKMWFNPDIPVGSDLWTSTGDNMERFILKCNEKGISLGTECQATFGGITSVSRRAMKNTRCHTSRHDEYPSSDGGLKLVVRTIRKHHHCTSNCSTSFIIRFYLLQRNQVPIPL